MSITICTKIAQYILAISTIYLDELINTISFFMKITQRKDSDTCVIVILEDDKLCGH